MKCDDSNRNNTYIIAEIGSNHNQDLSKAIELMHIAKECGADAVKFQSIRLDEIISDGAIDDKDRTLFKSIELNENWYGDLFSASKEIGIDCISAPTYLNAVDLLISAGTKIIKIASPQTYGFPALIEKVAETGAYTILSTGYCEKHEIERAVNCFLAKGEKENLCIMHCVSEYPTEYSHCNLTYLNKLKRYGVDVGLSDHTLGISVPIAAVALGAKVIEKHITMSRNDVGPDHFFALEPNEFKKMVIQIREVEEAIGGGEKSIVSAERIHRDSVVVYPYSARNIKKGSALQREDIVYYRNKCGGISPWNVDELMLGKRINRDVSRHELLGADLFE